MRRNLVKLTRFTDLHALVCRPSRHLDLCYLMTVCTERTFLRGRFLKIVTHNLQHRASNTYMGCRRPIDMKFCVSLRVETEIAGRNDSLHANSIFEIFIQRFDYTKHIVSIIPPRGKAAPRCHLIMHTLVQLICLRG